MFVLNATIFKKNRIHKYDSILIYRLSILLLLRKLEFNTNIEIEISMSGQIFLSVKTKLPRSQIVFRLEPNLSRTIAPPPHAAARALFSLSSLYLLTVSVSETGEI